MHVRDASVMITHVLHTTCWSKSLVTQLQPPATCCCFPLLFCESSSGLILATSAAILHPLKGYSHSPSAPSFMKSDSTCSTKRHQELQSAEDGDGGSCPPSVHTGSTEVLVATTGSACLMLLVFRYSYPLLNLWLLLGVHLDKQRAQ